MCRWGSRLWGSQLSLWCIAWTTSCINYRCVCMCARAQKFTQNCYCACFQTPQSPIVRPYLYDQYCVDEYPLGTNAVVAVITYTVSESLKWLRSFLHQREHIMWTCIVLMCIVKKRVLTAVQVSLCMELPYLWCMCGLVTLSSCSSRYNVVVSRVLFDLHIR